MDSGKNDKQKRRIPQSLRRRALMSCDRCKKRRVRCLRSPNAPPEDGCQNCVESGVKCEATLPRKQRIYGSVETLSLRYRVLDALVKGLFPDEDTEDTDTLFRIAQAHNIATPSPNDHTPAEHALNSPAHPSPGRAAIVAPCTTYEGNPFAIRTAKVPEEKLIPTPHGISHYIGPSSSFAFAFAVRTMVAERHRAQDQRWTGRAYLALQSDFASLRTSKALEPKESPNVTDDGADLELAKVANGQSQKNPSPPPPKDDPLTSFLPAKEVADALVDAFFDQVHPNYLLFHRGTFQLRYESIWARNAIQLSELEPGWICSIFMVFVFGAQALEHHDKHQAILFQRRYLGLVQSRLHNLINTTSLVNIQALLLLQLLQHNASERNSAWMLLGCAARMAISLGMHREGATGGFDPIEKQVRRRVWWTLYMFEQNLCMVLGRPSAIDDLEVNVSLPSETMLDGGDCVPPGYIDYSLRLTQISSGIKRTIYAAPTPRLQQDNLPTTSVSRQLLLDLEAWYRSLPPQLCLEGNALVLKQRRAVLLLHIHYYHTRTLVTRPYLLRKINLELAQQLHREPPFPDMDPDGLSLSHVCVTASHQAAVLFHELAARGILDGVAWLDVYYAYHSVLVLSLDFLVSNGDAEDSPEDLARKAAVRDVVAVMRSAKLCPTFQILAQVAVQFAGIVGIFDEGTPSHERPRDAAQPQDVAQPQPPSQFTAQGDIAGIINEWFQPNSPDVPWDFFDVGGYAGMQNNVPNQPLAPFGGTFGGMFPGLDNEIDTFSSAIERLILPNSSVSNWDSVIMRNDRAAEGNHPNLNGDIHDV